jgi:transmembrane sensor
MSRNIPRPNQQILEEASTWFVAFRSRDLAENARQQFQEWLKRSPEHIRAYLEIASIYADIPAPEHGYTPPELIAKARASADSNVLVLAAAGERPQEPPAASLAQEPNRGSRKARRSENLGAGAFSGTGWFLASRIALAMSVLIFAAIGIWSYIERNTYRTGIGEQRSITLSDGSLVELNARSAVRIAFRDGQRDVELLEGQALFRVAKDSHRPFIVQAGTTSVRAVGTQFDVYRKSKGTTVTVIEGRVAVLAEVDRAAATTPTTLVSASEESRAAPDPTAPATQSPRTVPGPQSPHGSIPRMPAATNPMTGILLAAGEQMTVTATGSEKAQRPNIAAATAWTQHQLVFDGTPLGEVLEEFGRYTTRRIIVDTPALAGLEISGQYTSTNPDSLLRFLSLQRGVVITEVDGETHIRQE